jgi:carbonic anhydrase
MRTDWITVLSLMAAASMPAIVPAQDAEHYVSPWRTPWTYEQAGNWGQLDPSYALCGVGKKQSPIDIRDVQKAALPALVFEYMRGPLKRVINNGHTIRVNYHDAPGTGDSLIVGGKRYQLTQFHFHRPSEEDVDGKSFAMWMHMPKTEGQEEVSGVEINPADLLPHDPGYYMYMGSQTAPPCSEGITWFVLKTPIEVSAEQISAFARLYPRDIRPIQPLNGRIVKGSQ